MSTLPEQKCQTARVSRRKKALLTIYEIAVFGMLGAVLLFQHYFIGPVFVLPA